ncbi:MAG: ABC transporter substrate-binding protein [Stackebrandtia sp.]
MKPSEIDVSRRRLFQAVGIGAAGAAGLGGLSACSKADPGVEDAGSFHGAYPYEQPPDGHYNAGGLPYAPVPRFTFQAPYLDLITMPAALWYWHDKEWLYLLAESSELDEGALKFTVKVREGLTWDDDKPVTAGDFMTTLWIQYMQRAPVWSSIESIEADGDYGVVVNLKNPSAVIERYILRGNIIASHGADEEGKTYGDFAAEAAALFEDGKDMDSEDGAKLGEEFQDFRPTKLIASGPFNIDADSITDTEMTLTRNDKGYGVDQVKFERIIIHNGETPEIDPLVQDSVVDYATHGFSPNQEKAHIDSGKRILRPPNYNGPALFINFKDLGEFDDVRVRRALAHAVNREDNGAIALGESGVAVEYMAGFSDIQVPDWMSAEDIDKLDVYEYDQDAATALLEDAGWTKDGDAWKTPDGKAAEYELSYPGEFADWSGSAENLAEQLTAFGITVTLNPIDHERYVDEMYKSNFQFGIQAWGSSQHPHPHFAFVADLFNYNTPIAKNSGGDGIAFDLNVETEAYGDLDLEEVVNEAGNGLDEAEQKANVTKAAIAFNELLPIIPLFERYGNNPVQEGEGQRVKEFPADDDPILENSVYADNPIVMKMLTGELEPNKAE